MAEVRKKSSDIRKRPKTPQDFGLLKTIRYEDTEDGMPPVPVASINPPQPPSSLPTPLREQVNAHRPKTSPSPNAATPPAIPYDVKRDSAIAPSFSTADRASYAESHLTGVAKEPSLPTIVVQDDETSGTAERSRSPFARKKRQEKRRSRSASPGIQRIRSFKGIQSSIPSGDLEGMDLEDLASDRIAFSHRGSIIFGGRRMNRLLETPAKDTPLPEGTTSSAPSNGEQTSTEDITPIQNAPKQGLFAGRRKPSVHMLQAALQNGRVLSAEEITFSMKVRSMYEHGDERAAEWVTPKPNGEINKELAEGEVTDSSTPDQSIDAIVVGKTRDKQKSVHPALRSPNELAGGIEDWEDVDARDVDRYGFISMKKRSGTPTSRTSPTPEQSIQRVATSLRIESDQPRRNRKPRRGPSVNSRASRSVPPRPSNEDTSRVGSTHSAHSNKSIGRLHSGNLFRSKATKTLNEASDMLTLPPGLADIAEQEDGGRTSSTQKRKEWEREAKWQKMAHPLPQHDGKGGGMRFDFDTNDSKLVSRTWKGIPDRWRATAWYSFLSSSAKKRGIAVDDDDIIKRFHELQDASSPDDVQIDVDVPRTINMHIMFRRRYRGGQRLLFRVLHAISLYFPDTGYVQGMASLAATLLCYYDEDRAFVMMVRLWQLRGLEKLFQSGFEGLMSALNEFEADWLKGGDVAQKLEELCITSTAYGTRWYLTLFNMSIPFPAQLRVWDAFMLLGDASDPTNNAFGGADLDVLHATSAALIDATREIILDSDFENTMKVLTSFVPIKDEDLLMRVARTEWRLRKKRGTSKAS
ncbi:hypothetical protein LTR37_012897 [Vermiconidia calcicola]|uniref:Uncharacterized protein n=1 Tax=Vermiconidia calcicola TaxID=1690605 RepID=A0ACC3MYM9_9PEZI|nr:hypothetical protein LTR37_012897 [Vermiconidia calcicola]